MKISYFLLHPSAFPSVATSYPPLHHAVVAQRGGGTPQALSSFRRHTSYFPSRPPLLAAACFKAGYIDAWGRGIEKMTHACESAGLPTPTFESNSGGVLATFTLHPASVGPVDLPKSTTAQVEAQSRAQSNAILHALANEPLSANALVSLPCLKSKTGAFKRSVNDLIDAHLIEYTIPDKPKSRLQKYRLTEKGRKIKSEG